MTRGYSSVWLDPRACDPPDPIPAVTTIDDVAAALDVAFAGRYLDALNGYFHPDRYPKPTCLLYTSPSPRD